MHDTSLRTIRQRAEATARAALDPNPGKDRSTPVRSLYIHVPFCTHKCGYCDFYSIVDTRDRQTLFARRLRRELPALAPWARGAPLQTIFIGGGTPTLLPPEHWRQILAVLERDYDLSEIRAGRGEFTVEANPETVTPELLDVLVAGGVDRLSMGAQSFDRRHLAALERSHDPESVPRALALARSAGIRRTSIDLIFGIPGQTPEDWERDLARALELGTEHLSCYNLTYEPGTAMTARLARHEIAACDEDDEVRMFESTPRILAASGLLRYEISNFARPGAESRHNLVYWRHGEWLAAGPGAAGHVAGRRWKNVPRLDEYLSHDDDGFSPILDLEHPDPGRALVERIMTGLRLAEGLDAAELEREVASVRPDALTSWRLAVARQADRGLIQERDGRWSLTDRGILIANRVVGAVVAVL